MRILMTLVCAAVLAGCNVEADFSGALKTETLAAEQYQKEIIAIDRLVFQEKSLGDDGVHSLEKQLNDLAGRVKAAKEDSKFLQIESLELKRLAIRAKRLSAGDNGEGLQNDWMRIRNNLFDDRAWFARSANDLDYAASVTAEATTTAAPPAVAEPEPVVATTETVRASEPRSTLAGRWQVVSVTANGQPRSDAELDGSIWTFDPPRMTVRSSNGSEKTYNATPDGTWLPVSSPGGEDGWMKYELDGEGLRIAFFDGLKGKPSSFEVPATQDPLLVVVRLVPVR